MSKGISMFYEYFPKVCSLDQDGVKTCLVLLIYHEPSQCWRGSDEKGFKVRLWFGEGAESLSCVVCSSRRLLFVMK